MLVFLLLLVVIVEISLNAEEKISFDKSVEAVRSLVNSIKL